MAKTYTVKKYIAEREENGELTKQTKEIIYNLIEKKKKAVIYAGLGTGKSDISLKVIRSILSENKYEKIQLLIVTSSKKLTENLCNRALSDDPNDTRKAIPCNGDYGKIELDEQFSPVVSTPESLYKAIAGCKDKGRRFYIIYDEVHEVPIKGVKFRRKLNQPFKAYEEDLCFGLLGLTGTPDNIKLFNWDEEISIKVENPNVKTKQIFIANGIKNNAAVIANKILYIMKKYPNHKIVIRINNKDRIEEIRKILKKFCEDVGVWYANQPDDKYKELLNEATQTKEIVLPQILLTTCLVDAGVEIFSKDKPIIIDYFDENSTLIESKQFIGRFRNGVTCVFFLMEMEALEMETKIDSLEKIYNNHLEMARAEMNSLIGEIAKRNVFRCSYTKNENGRYSYYIDDMKIINYAFSDYINQLFPRPHKLANYLLQDPYFVVEKVTVIDFQDKNQLQEEEEALKEKKKLEINRKTKLTKEFKKKVEKDKEFREMMLMKKTEYDSILSIPEEEKERSRIDVDKYEEYKELYEHFHKEKKEDIKLIFAVSEIKNIEPQEVMRKFYNKKEKEEIKDIIIEVQFRDVKRIYHSSPVPMTPINNSATNIIPKYNVYYFIRQWVKNKNNNEIGLNLGKNNQKDLFEWLNDPKRKRYFPKIASEKILGKYLENVYHLDSRNRITSVQEY